MVAGGWECVCGGGGLALGFFGGTRNVLYLDYNGGYIIACTYENS